MSEDYFHKFISVMCSIFIKNRIWVVPQNNATICSNGDQNQEANDNKTTMSDFSNSDHHSIDISSMLYISFISNHATSVKYK